MPDTLSSGDGPHFEPGALIDQKFEVRRLLGVGAMGAVVEAQHLLRRAPVALKFMSPRLVDLPGVVERFLNEGVAASRIDCEHVVKVLDVSKLPSGQPYLVMEYLDGEDLEQLLKREGKHGLEPLERPVHFVLQILRGLSVAHQAGIIHRDLKPANCFVVTRDGEPDFIKLVDFGISKVEQPEDGYHLTQEGTGMGTPLYVSPEQARDATSVDARSDLYSVSVILYELLSGRLPYEPKSLADLYMQLASGTPRPLQALRPDLPQGLSALVHRGLANRAEDRFQSATEMGYALAPFGDSRSELVLRRLLARPSNPAARGPSWPPRTTPLPAPDEALPVTKPRPPPGPLGTVRGPVETSTLRSVSLAADGSSVIASTQEDAKPLALNNSRRRLAAGLVLALIASGAALLAFGARTSSPPALQQGEDPAHASAAAQGQLLAPDSTAAVHPPTGPSPALANPAPHAVEAAASPDTNAAASATTSAAAPTPTHPARTPTARAAASTPITRKPELKNIGIQD